MYHTVFVFLTAALIIYYISAVAYDLYAEKHKSLEAEIKEEEEIDISEMKSSFKPIEVDKDADKNNGHNQLQGDSNMSDQLSQTRKIMNNEASMSGGIPVEKLESFVNATLQNPNSEYAMIIDAWKNQG